MISNGNLAAKQKQKTKCATCAKVNKTDKKKRKKKNCNINRSEVKRVALNEKK